ncbi:uncharacterized protein L199_002868 [Kwoniella botswanensis]|uniref:uncharacterized protein n=1 Tax=Kwoniella botswanensis TaxID=1268659 RepID=UPI00315D91EB
MTDPVKPRRKVASQISLAPSPSPIPSSSAALGRGRAHVTPSSISTSSPTSSERPSLRSTPSALSLRSTPVSRARSPAPASQSSNITPHPRVTTRTPRTPISSTLPPRSVVGLTPKDGTPIAKIRATKSVVDGHSSPRTPELRRNNTEEHVSRTRTLSLRSTAGGAPIARVRTSGTANIITPSTPVHPIQKSESSITPVHRTSTPAHSIPTQDVTPTSFAHPISTAPSPSIQTPPPGPIQQSPIPNNISTPADGGYSLTGLGMDDGGLRILQSTWRDSNTSPERLSDSAGDQIDISSNRSSPSRRSPKVLPQTLTSAQHALAYIFQHPTASAPTSPVPSSSPPHHHTSHRNGIHVHPKTKLPYHPHGAPPPSLPRPPTSPELRTVALPAMTPGRSSEELSRTTSSQGTGGFRKFSGTSSDMSGPLMEMRKDESRDRLSGATAVDDVELRLGEVKIVDQDMDAVMEADAEEAKVNRKIADLEISNASLLAINKTLEATKSKQRTEILKLRRMLRESINGNALPSFSSLNPSSSLGLLSPTTDTFDEELDPEGAYFDEEMADPQLEARWDKIADLVGNMKRRAETAVQVGKEEIKIGQGRVLGWMEVEQSRLKEQEHEDADLSVDSVTPNEHENDEYVGETSREEVDNVI